MLSAWLLVFLLGGAPEGLVASGPPALVLSGDAAAVLAVRGALDDRNVPLSPVPRALAARIEPSADGLALTIRDGAGRTAVHQVASPALAAALIESWMRPDLTGPLLAARSLPPMDEPVTIAAPPPPPPADRADVTLMAETGLASDGSLWTGASATAALHLGRLRVGPRARLAAQTVPGTSRLAVYKEDKDATLGRLDAALLLALDFPIALGHWWLSPGLAVGGAWSRARATHEEKTTVAAGFAPRAEADLTLTVPLGARLGLDVGLALGLAPSLRGSTTQDDFTLPAEAPGQLRGGIGLRYGRPR